MESYSCFQRELVTLFCSNRQEFVRTPSACSFDRCGIRLSTCFSTVISSVSVSSKTVIPTSIKGYIVGKSKSMGHSNTPRVFATELFLHTIANDNISSLYHIALHVTLSRRRYLSEIFFVACDTQWSSKSNQFTLVSLKTY